jgi:hypothetical protein
LAVLNPDHLLQQAASLAAPQAGAPRQVDLRRAISAAYYGVFHFVLTAAADEIVGRSRRGTDLYALVYRSIGHRSLRELCNEVRKQQLPARYQKYSPKGGFGPDLQAFADALTELQEQRHVADYDPSTRIKTSDAAVAIAVARRAILRFQGAHSARRTAFLTLLLFPPR